MFSLGCRITILLLFYHVTVVAQSEGALQQNMNLSCIDVKHISASGEELSYENYFESFSLDGQGAYKFGTLGKYGKQEGQYSFDGQGHAKFTGPLGAMHFSYQYLGKEKNPYDKQENKYAFTFTEPNGTRHTCNCIVMRREKPVAPLPKPAAGGVKLSGVYFYYTPDMYSPMTGAKQTFSKYYYFMPNGYVYMGLPAKGLEKCNCSDPTYAKKCKTYTISGNTITFSGEKPQAFGRKGNDLLIDKKTFWPVPLVKESSLPGNYKLMWSATGAVHQTFWNFKSDHHFTQTSVGTASPGAVFGIPTNSNAKELTGTWAVKGGTLELHYSSGEVKTHTLVRTYGQQDEITIDGVSCYKQ